MQLLDVVGKFWKRTVDGELLSDDRRRIVAAAMEFPLEEIIARYRRQENVSEWYAQDIERELRRYLAICAMHPGQTIPMYGPVDKLWHIFITFTRDYAAFCEKVAGRFIHHMPERDARGGLALRRDARRFAKLYRRAFGHLPPSNVWPAMALLGLTRRGIEAQSRRDWAIIGSSLNFACGGGLGCGGGAGGGHGGHHAGGSCGGSGDSGCGGGGH